MINPDFNKNSPYGYDIDLFLDFTNDVRSCSGKRLVINALVGRLVDSLFYEPSYGIQLPERLKRIEPATLGNLATEVERELERDDRVKYINCRIDFDENNKSVNVYIDGELSATDEPFEFVGSIDDVRIDQNLEWRILR